MRLIILALTACFLATPQHAGAAEVRAFVTGAAQASFEALVPAFERATGHKVVAEFDLPLTLVKKVEAGEAYDVLILSYDVAPLIQQGKLAAGSRTVLGRVGVGVAVRQGSPKPDFSTIEAFKRTLLDAKKIRTGRGGTTARLLSNGEVDLAVTGLPPLIGTPGIEWLGYLPDEIQSWLLFTGGLNATARQPEAGRALLQTLTTPGAMAVWKANGVEAP